MKRSQSSTIADGTICDAKKRFLRFSWGALELETEEQPCLKNHWITRSELRRRREEEMAASERNQKDRC